MAVCIALWQDCDRFISQGCDWLNLSHDENVRISLDETTVLLWDCDWCISQGCDWLKPVTWWEFQISLDEPTILLWDCDWYILQGWKPVTWFESQIWLAKSESYIHKGSGSPGPITIGPVVKPLHLWEWKQEHVTSLDTKVANPISCLKWAEKATSRTFLQDNRQISVYNVHHFGMHLFPPLVLVYSLEEVAHTCSECSTWQ